MSTRVPKKILLVDDDERLLHGMARRLRAINPSWEVSQAYSAQQGLEMLEKQAFDLVVSDLQMPVMDGAVFLGLVRDRYPRVIRFVLSGHARQDVMLRATSLSHQYFVKPCDTSVLAKAIEESLYNTSTIAQKSLRDFILHFDQFQFRSTIYTQLVSILDDSKKGLDKVAEIISEDPALAAKVMQVANSSFFGLPQRVVALGDAVTILGSNAIKALTLMLKFFENFDKVEFAAMPSNKIWEHSINTAAIAAKIAEKYFEKPGLKEELRTISLLHDLGKLILANYAPGRYAAALDRSKREQLPLSVVEQMEFQISHAEAGALLFELWGLPKELCAAIRWHQNPSAATEKVDMDVLAALHIADALEHVLYPQSYFLVDPLDVKYLQQHNLALDIKYWQELVSK